MGASKSTNKNPSPPVGLGLMGGLFGRLRLITVSQGKNADFAVWFRGSKRARR